MSRYIDADKLIKFFPDDGEGNWTYNVTAQSYINIQPSVDVVQSQEPLTDAEQRIFLKAMGREEEVCKIVDEEYKDEEYTLNLVHVCQEIIRKVKGTLWT